MDNTKGRVPSARRGGRCVVAGFLLALAGLLLPGLAGAWSPLAVSDDALVRMPGTQPGQVTLEDPSQCYSCHEGFDPQTEPALWEGSMMAQAARDPLFWAAMTVAQQDSIWAVGRPNAGDLCLRCHFPQGWLEGRSDPVNASLMTGSDFDGVHCAFCHRQVDPFFQATYDGTREGTDWDETDLSTTPSSDAAYDTLLTDEAVAATLELFNGLALYDPVTNLPEQTNYTESAGGQYVVAAGTDRRGPFADANASHGMLYSRFHKSRYFCGTCHDVSNPVLANLAHDGTPPGDGMTVLPSESSPAHAYGHIERTFSEFMLSDFGQDGGAPGSGYYAPENFDTSQPGNAIATCQDCHMPDVAGRAASQPKAVLRPSESDEHPGSGVPQHDLTGGNAWVPWLLASAVPGSANHDPVNQALLEQGASVLTLDLTQGLGLNPTALLAGRDRSLANLQRAATLEEIAYSEESGELSFRTVNHTGHKLISGYPEGRRMWLNMRAWDADGALVREVNAYDAVAATLKGLSEYTYDTTDLPAPAPLAPTESIESAWIYEMLSSSTLTGEAHTFHMALADGRAKDNRIPPRGFRIAEASDRQVQPTWNNAAAPAWFSAAEYAGGYDEQSVPLPPGTTQVQLTLYYQTTSREFIGFLRDEINGTADSLTGTGAGGDPAYLVQTDAYFDALAAWGDTIWSLWLHNREVPGAAPVVMAQAQLAVCTPLVLTNDLFTGNGSYRGCPTVTVGPNWRLDAGGVIHLSASQQIILGPGFSVAKGGVFSAEVSP